MMMFEEVERLWHKHFNGASKVEALSWPSVELPGNGIEFRLRETGKVGALGETLHGAFIGGVFWHSNKQCAALYWMPLPQPPKTIDAAREPKP